MDSRNTSDWEQAQLEEELLEESLRKQEFEPIEDLEPDTDASTEPTDPDVRPKHPWQITKESWYDKLNVSVRQLDIVIGAASVALLIVVILIILDATGLR